VPDGLLKLLQRLLRLGPPDPRAAFRDRFNERDTKPLSRPVEVVAIHGYSKRTKSLRPAALILLARCEDLNGFVADDLAISTQRIARWRQDADGVGVVRRRSSLMDAAIKGHPM